jgi:uncharacterized protein (DUF2062 family)
MINLPEGATPMQFLAGVAIASAAGAIATNLIIYVTRRVVRRIRTRRHLRRLERQMAEVYRINI